MATYTYSLASDFGGSIKEHQFHEEVDGESGITSGTLVGINLSGDVVDIIFDGSLSGGEQTTLDGLVSSHTPDNSKPREKFFIATPNRVSTKSTNYQKLGTFKYGGSKKLGTIDYIDIISYKEESPTSYSVRIHDRTNDQQIAEVTGLTNTEEEDIDMGTISNVPTDPAVLEVHAKRVGANGNSRKIYVDSVTIYHGN